MERREPRRTAGTLEAFTQNGAKWVNLVVALKAQQHCSTGYSGTTACEQEIQRLESFAGVTEPSCGSTPGQASRDNLSAGVATPSARATVGAGDAASWAVLLGRPGTGVAMKP